MTEMEAFLKWDAMTDKERKLIKSRKRKRFFGWVLFYLGLFIVNLIFIVPAIEGFELKLSPESLYIIMPAILCFTGWFFLIVIAGRREKKEKALK